MLVLTLEELDLLTIVDNGAKAINREDFGKRGPLLGEIHKCLCWHYDKPWSRKRRCKKGRLLMIELVEESEHEGEDLEYDEEDLEEEPQPTDCTVHALAGYANLRMMKIGGFLKQQPVTVLIDIGSNFVNNKVVVDVLSRLPE
ncbi:hypothetical protein B296_00034268 [Ensete ventricosum]|uniref:Uncharacterized protein n=1 Tax=Ensete ventricosum TaxID=4639 RepID=A0A427A912_ENSVE|nr:hypothetical protein B296_00034268 [Ensete ventricosum]